MVDILLYQLASSLPVQACLPASHPSNTPGALASPALPSLDRSLADLTVVGFWVCLQMVKNSGSTNYTMVDIERLLHLDEQTLPFGRDEWERLTVSYNASRTLSENRPEMPPHIMTTKEIKFAIDGKANVIEIDDEADCDQRFVELDFSFEADPDDDFLDGVGEGLQHAVGHGAGLDDSLAADESVAGNLSGSSESPSRGEFQGLLAAPIVGAETGARATTHRPAPLRSPQHPRFPASRGPHADQGRSAGG
ncbi:hypothetical protein ON010_g744 [Phytophthora cinnamomi]|nr:hypothetical protein ON010_g744 [Phytophthora cinnamomi]